MTDTEKLTRIAKINQLWIDNTNDEDGDKFLSDATLAMEAVDSVLADVDPAHDGNLRMWIEAGA